MNNRYYDWKYSYPKWLTYESPLQKLDKFTVLRLALQHIKSLLGSARPAAGAASLYKPSFVSDEEIKQLMKYSNDGFILVADCDRARILFTSQSTEQAVKRESKVIIHLQNIINTKHVTLNKWWLWCWW